MRINKNPKNGNCALRDVFPGIRHITGLKRILGKHYSDIIENTRVVLEDKNVGYMRISKKIEVLISPTYLKTAKPEQLYLDLIHELVHVRQSKEGKKIFDLPEPYIERATEIEAYRAAISEGKRKRLPRKFLLDHANVFWLSKEEQEKLARKIGL